MVTMTELEAELTKNRFKWSFNSLEMMWKVEEFDVSFLDGHFYIGKDGKKVFFTDDVSEVLDTFKKCRFLKEERSFLNV